MTSPPYYRLRRYGEDPAELGQERSVGAYLEQLLEVFAQARRVLRHDGTLWINIGDSYSTASGARRGSSSALSGRLHDAAQLGTDRAKAPVRKNLLNVPARLAIALQDQGWILRNDIIWHKANATPESVTDRFAKRHEHLYFFSLNQRYAFDLDAVRVPHAASTLRRAQGRGLSADRSQEGIHVPTTLDPTQAGHPNGANPGDVWTLPTRPSPIPHTAMFPIDIPLRCLAASTRPGDIVLDPFSGAGTTGLAARQLDRDYIGIDLYPENHHEAAKRFLAERRS